MHYIVSAIVTMVLTASAYGFSAAQPAQEVQQLFAQLQDAKTSNDAAVRLKVLAESSADAMQYLAMQLPQLITKTSQSEVWLNSVRLAGDLRIAETVPILVKLFDGESHLNFVTPESPVSFTTTMTERDRLDNDSVGKALAKIGEPAIEPVRNILENNSNSQSMRLRAAHVLYNMNSTSADAALAHDLQSETDPRVKSSIEARLKARKKTSNQ